MDSSSKNHLGTLVVGVIEPFELRHHAIKLPDLDKRMLKKALTHPLLALGPFVLFLCIERTRPDTRLPKSRAGGQGPYLRSLDHLGRSSGVKEIKSYKKIKCDRPTD